MKFNNLFTGQLPKVPDSPIVSVLAGLQNAVNQQGSGQFATPGVAKASMALESMTADNQMQLNTAVQNLANTIDSAVKTISGFKNLSIAQESASICAGVISANPSAYLSKPIPTEAQLRGAAGPNTTVIGHSGLADTLENRGIAIEAYDNKENKNALVYSVAYNMQASRQDEFGEAFFPTVVVSPDNVGFMVSIRLIYVQDLVRRQLSGSLNQFNRKNIIKAVVDATILKDDATRIVPVVRTGGGANDSTAYFVASGDVAPYNVTNDNEVVSTAPLKVGATFSLLGISQTAAVIAGGVLDQTDAIDSSVRLSSIYVKIAAGADPVAQPATVVKFNVKDLPLTDFNAAVQANTRSLTLNFDTASLKVTSTTKDVVGAAIPQLSVLASNTVRLSSTMFGKITQDTGDTVVNTGAVGVAKITSTDGLVLSQAAGTGATIAAVFAGATVIGYDLIARRTNSNRRQQGQFVDTQFINHLYTVPLLSPITALRPLGETEANDSAQLSALITTTKIRTSNAAVTAILEAQAFLKEFVNANDTATEQPEGLGVARYLVTATYLEDTLDASTATDSLRSAQRAEDVVATIINKLRDMTYRLYAGSAYKAATDAMFDGAAPKPLLIIGTDQVLGRYLTLNGDMRTLGDQFDFKLVTTLDSRMTGKILFSFGMETSYNSGVPNPLHAGSMAWKPELTLQLPLFNNGATSMNLSVSPSYRHVWNLPVMGALTVTNIDAIIAAKATVNVSQ